jgi:molybdopterin-guanine dinucleotide biosynthesis protein A
MGCDKALVELAGRPLIDHAISILRAAGLSTEIAGARAALDHYAQVIEDPSSGLGPLAGICAALASTAAQTAIFLPIDLPFLPSSLLRGLIFHASITGAPVTIASVNGFPQTFPAVLDRAVLPWLQSELHEGRRGCFNAFHAASRELGSTVSILPAELLAQTGQAAHPHALPTSLWFHNVNSPAPLARAHRIISRMISRSGSYSGLASIA